ncbi:MAG TPA: T9SS type A sorting domain-containing protein, partial [Chryseosolibacter sp.]
YPDTLAVPVIEIKDDTLFTRAVASYQWKKDGVEIPGATLPYYAPLESGSYTVVAASGGCSRESTAYAYSTGDPGDGGNPGDGGDNGDGDPVTGLEQAVDREFALQVFPVPTSGYSINVLLRSPKTTPVLIEIMDLLGKVQYSRSMDARTLFNGISIEPSVALYEGIYLVRATQGDLVARKKIVVRK